MTSALRPPAVAGMFYPGTAAALQSSVDLLLDQALASAPLRTDAVKPKVLLAPHAGYIYSGATAALAYSRLLPQRSAIRRVVLLGPCHRVAITGLALPDCAAFATPLGPVALDQAACGVALQLPQVHCNPAAHAEEHALEVHLPFLQRVIGNFQLVPLAVGQASPEDVAQVLDLLWGGEETLLIISTDLSHYHTYAEAQQRDKASVSAIIQLQPLTSHEQACGATPINGLLHCARQRGLQPQLLALCNSGDTAGDKQRVVGYTAIAFHEPTVPTLDDAALGHLLLSRARNALNIHFGLPLLDAASHPLLQQAAATFVTLTQNGQLRGCMGSLQAHRPLAEDVHHNAVAAALRDPRFTPLAATELAQTRIEVSLLTPAQILQFDDEADALRQLRPLVDGVIFSANAHRATFLPQVWEHIPDPRQFLAQLKCKAGLPADYWSEQVQLARYQVRKWQEA